MEIGWRVPTYARKWTKVADSRKLVKYFTSVEEHDFKSLWVIDHLLVAPNVYSVAWQDPLITLAVAGAVTEKLKMELGFFFLGFVIVASASLSFWMG